MRKLLAIHHLNINSKKLFGVITNIMVHIDNCYSKTIISYSKYSILLIKLDEIIENFNIKVPNSLPYRPNLRPLFISILLSCLLTYPIMGFSQNAVKFPDSAKGVCERHQLVSKYS